MSEQAGDQPVDDPTEQSGGGSGGGSGGDADGGTGEEPGLGLDEVLAALRHDLTAARDASDADAYGLGVSQVEIELTVEIGRRRSADGGLGVKWFVLTGDARARAERDDRESHRIRLTLGPVPSERSATVTSIPSGQDRTSSGGETIGPRIADDA